MSMLEMVMSALGGGQSQQLGQQLGLNPQQTQTAVGAAIPMILGGLSRNAQTPDGEAALASALQQHDGSILDQVQGGQLPDLHDGSRIAGHALGGDQQGAAQAVGRAAGIDPGMAMQVISMVAPLVMGALSRRTQGLGSGGVGAGGLGGAMGQMGGGDPTGGLGGMLGGVLSGGNQNMGAQAGGNTGGLGGMLGQVLGQEQSSMTQNLPGMLGGLGQMIDRDGDGNPMDEIMGMLGKLGGR